MVYGKKIINSGSKQNAPIEHKTTKVALPKKYPTI